MHHLPHPTAPPTQNPVDTTADTIDKSLAYKLYPVPFLVFPSSIDGANVHVLLLLKKDFYKNVRVNYEKSLKIMVAFC